MSPGGNAVSVPLVFAWSSGFERGLEFGKLEDEAAIFDGENDYRRVWVKNDWQRPRRKRVADASVGFRFSPDLVPRFCEEFD